MTIDDVIDKFWCAAVGCNAHDKDKLRTAILSLLNAEAEACAEVAIAQFGYSPYEGWHCTQIVTAIRARIAGRKGGA